MLVKNEKNPSIYAALFCSIILGCTLTVLSIDGKLNKSGSLYGYLPIIYLNGSNSGAIFMNTDLDNDVTLSFMFLSLQMNIFSLLLSFPFRSLMSEIYS